MNLLVLFGGIGCGPQVGTVPSPVVPSIADTGRRPPSPREPPPIPSCGSVRLPIGVWNVDPCQVWRGAPDGMLLGAGVEWGRLGEADVLVAGAPCGGEGSEHSSNTCYHSGLVALSTLPFGDVLERDLTWVEPDSSYFFGYGFAFVGDVAGVGAGVASRGQHGTYFLPTLPESQVAVSNALQPFPSSDVLLLETDPDVAHDVVRCGDVTGDGTDDVCTQGGVVRILAGPTAEEWAEYPPGLVGMGRFLPDGPRTGVWLAEAPSGEVGVYLEVPSPGPHGAFSGPPAWENPPGLLHGQGDSVIADVDGDGDDDLVLPDKVADGKAGRIVVLVDAGTDPFGHRLLELTGPVPLGLAGAAMEVADLDQDGHVDLVVGAPGAPYSGVRGRVYILPGPLSEAHWSQAVIWESSWEEDAFGNWLTVADIDGDSTLDVVVGAERASLWGVQGGAVYVIDDPLRQD